MKPIKFLIPLILLVLCIQASCEKNDENPNPDSLIGKWKYIGYSGGILGWDPYEGPVIYIIFSKDSLFKKIKNGKIILETQYYVKNGKKVPGWGKSDTIYYKKTNEELPFKEVFTINGETLLMWLPEKTSGNYGQIGYYKRTK